MKIRSLKAFSISTILGFLGLLLVIRSFSAGAATGGISCTTAFGEKSFVIEDNRISFHKDDETGASRSISSMNSESVRTHKKNLGFSKTLYIDGNKHRINVLDVNQFSDVNDYLSITSPKGHEMTYPLSCHSV
ncbi:MAG TPA: hypothetical protein VNJ01_11440 [Bacteriovoracaceae bacterium]|nr:hypothetical protein [Bacteriovoracaceae bacterium]